MGSPEDDQPAPRRRKRASGDGSVYHNKKGEWFASLVFQAGQRPYVVRAVSEKDAVAKLRELIKQRDAKIQTPTAQTVEQWFEKWMRDVVMVHGKRKTQHDYRQHIENYLLPIFGPMRLGVVWPDDVRAWQARLLKKGLAPSTINGAHTVLIIALNVAVDDRIIPYNPAASVRKLKVIKKKVTPLESDEFAAILWAVEGHRLEALYHLAFLGLRKGELLGLRVIDIDLDAGTLRIEQNAVELENSQMFIDTPKSENGVRILPLSEQLVPLLGQRLAMLAVERTQPNWEENGLLFPSECGTIMGQRSLGTHLSKTLALAGITKPWSWHKFRHTVITWLTDLEVPDPIIKRIVGHGDTTVTDGYRGKGSVEPLRKALAKMERVYLRGKYLPTEEQVRDRAWKRTSGTLIKKKGKEDA